MAQSGKEDRVKAIAYRVYLNRQLRQRSGNAHSDWQTAEALAQKPLKRILFWSHSGFLALCKVGCRSTKFVVWDIPKWGIFSLPKLEWVKLLAVPLVIAAAGSIITRNFQREAEQNRILKEYFALLETFTFEQGLLDEPLDSGVVLLARGRTVAALRELDLSRRQQLIAFLQASDLATVEFEQNSEDFQEPIISFKNQDLSELDLKDMNLSQLDFRSVSLRETNLRNNYFAESDFDDANLWKANLRGTYLEGVQLQNALLIEANLQGARLVNVNLQGAYLKDANLRGAEFTGADLSGVKGMTEDQLAEAILCKTILPKYLAMDGNRDCVSP